jgi:hypothetical protein
MATLCNLALGLLRLNGIHRTVHSILEDERR